MVPNKMKALVTTGEGNFELKDFDVPEPGRNEMLVKVVAVAQNPTDCMRFTVSYALTLNLNPLIFCYREVREVLPNCG